MGAVLAVIVGGVLALLVLFVLVALVVWMLALLAGLVFIVVGGVAEAAIAGAAGAPEPVVTLSAIGGAALTALVMRLAWTRRQRRRAVAAADDVIDILPRIVEPAPEPNLAEPVGFPEVAAAWQRAARLAPGARDELRRARNACAALLAWGRSRHHDDLPLVTAQVPGLVHDYAAAIEMADATVARDLRRRMVAQLVAIGEHARNIVETERGTLNDALAARELHLERRLSGSA